jgi:hypothetical protein
MNIFEPHFPFDESKSFYPLVMSYTAQLHGFMELASRGFKITMEEFKSRGLEEHNTLLETICNLPESAEKTAWQSTYQSGLTSLIGEKKLQSKIAPNAVVVNDEFLAIKTFFDYKAYIDHFMRMSSGSLVILAYEMTERCRTRDPLWEFLRHCRNAAAHRGYFNFQNGEPKRLAKWRNSEILPSLQGQPLFYDGNQSGFLGPGDVVYLLWDIEQSFPDIQ